MSWENDSLRLLSNIMKPNKGKIVGKVVPFLVMQDMDYQLFTESVESEMKFGSADNDLEKINSLLMKLGLTEFKDKIPFELSVDRSRGYYCNICIGKCQFITV